MSEDRLSLCACYPYEALRSRSVLRGAKAVRLCWDEPAFRRGKALERGAHLRDVFMLFEHDLAPSWVAATLVAFERGAS